MDIQKKVSLIFLTFIIINLYGCKNIEKVSQNKIVEQEIKELVTNITDAINVKKIITDTGMSINDVAKILGISIRMMRYYTSKRDNKPIPYCVQYSIESLKK